MATRMQQRRGTAQQWTDANPILAAGEIGFETDTGKFKMGNGSSAWSALSYFTDSSDFDTTSINNTINSTVSAAIAGVVAAAPGALDTLNELAAAIGDDPDFVSTITDAIDLKAPKDSPVFSGTVTLPAGSNVSIAGTTLPNYIAQETATLTSDVQAVTTQASNIASQVNTNEGTLTTLSGTVANLVSQVNTNEGTLNGLDTMLDTVSNTVDANGLTLTSAVADIATLETAVDNLQNADIQFASDISSNAQDISNVDGNVTTLTSTVNAIDLRLIDAEADIVSNFNSLDGDITALETSVSSHSAATTNVHGIADTSLLATTSYVDSAIGNTENYADTALALKANLESPALTGTPTAPTASVGTDTTQLATTAFVQDAIEAVVGAAPAALNTLSELADALADDANYASTVTSALALKAPLASPTFTGTVALPAASSVTLGGTALSTTLADKADKSATINTMNGSHTAVAADLGNLREMSGGGTFTIPSDNSFWPVGGTVDVLQTGSSQVTIAGASGVTVNATPGLKLRTQWSSATVLKRSANTFVVMGDLSA
jgi:hypothetical protein